MKTLTETRIGKIEYKDDEIINFANGIPGFENEKEFILVKADQDGTLVLLQSINTPELSFIIANPFSFYPDYEFKIDEQTKEELKIEKIEEVAVWGILSIPDDFQKATINLSAPLTINTKKRKGKQVILNDPNLQTKTPIFPHKAKKGGK